MGNQTKSVSALISTLAVAFSLSGSAFAAEDITSTSLYSADTLTFERWCSEIQHFDAARCALRNSADVANYQLTVSKLESAEIEYKKAQRQERDFKQSFSLYQTPNLGEPLK